MRGETLGVGETSESEAGSIDALTPSTNFRRGAWALADQGLFSATNFVVTVLLARWLPVAEFGAYTVAFALFLLASAIHAGITVEPLLVFAPGRFADAPTAFRRWLLRVHWRFSLVAGFLLVCTGLLFRMAGHANVGRAFIAFGSACPFLLLYRLLRRGPYVVGAVQRSVWAGLAYLVIAVIGAIILKSKGMLSIETAVACLSVASLLISPPLARGWVAVNKTDARQSAGFGRAWREYAPWSALSAILGLVPAQGYLVLLPLFTGLGETANLKAALNIVSPIMQGTAILSVMLLPSFVTATRAGRGHAAVMHAARNLVGGAVLLGVFVFLLGGWLVVALYGEPYRSAIPLTMLLAALPAMTAAVHVFAAGLRAAERPKQILLPNLAASLGTVLIGFPLIEVWGAQGAALAMPIVYAMTALLIWQRWQALPRSAVVGVPGPT